MTTTTVAYSARADEYTELLGSMSVVHPSDRQIIDSWAQRLPGRVLDAGCGPGHWTNYLAQLGLTARGIDIVPSFIDHARSTYPGIPFDVRSIDAIDEADRSLAGVLSWFSTIHHEPDSIAVPIAEFARVLRPEGQLVLGFFSGDSIEPFDHAVLQAFRWPALELCRILEKEGFDVLETHVREARNQRPVGAIVCERRPASESSAS
jgi:SAM-dependent methyltransferase